MADKKSEKTDVTGLATLEEELGKANDEVQQYLEKQAIKQGAYVEGNEDSDQNKPQGNTHTEVGWGNTTSENEKKDDTK